MTNACLENQLYPEQKLTRAWSDIYQSVNKSVKVGVLAGACRSLKTPEDGAKILRTTQKDIII
jgi:hypothetical protein